MNNLIYDINPLIISSIRVSKFERLGRHPAWNKVMRKKNPIRALLGAYTSGFFDGYYHATVVIRGAGGQVLKRIECRSNDHAVQLCADLNTKLNNFLCNLTINDRGNYE